MSSVNLDALFNKPRQFMILNSTDERIQMGYDAETFVVPAADEVVVEDPGHPTAPYSGRDSQGNYIPGSLVLSDNHEPRWSTDATTKPTTWSASEAIKHCLGIDVKTGQAESDYAVKGVSVVAMGASPEEIAKIRAAGEARYQVWLVKWARATVNGYQERAGKHRAIGLQPEPPGNEYDKAMHVLEVARNQSRGIELDEGRALEDMIDAKIRALAASKADDSVDLAKLVAALKADPDFVKMVKNQLIMAKPDRKRVE